LGRRLGTIYITWKAVSAGSERATEAKGAGPTFASEIAPISACNSSLVWRQRCWRSPALFLRLGRKRERIPLAAAIASRLSTRLTGLPRLAALFVLKESGTQLAFQRRPNRVGIMLPWNMP
jgi:hypothetical protein